MGKTWERAFVAQNKRRLAWNKRESVGGGLCGARWNPSLIRILSYDLF